MERNLALLDQVRQLYTPVVGDVMDRLGYRQQIMSPDLRPLWPEAVVAGYAFPVQAAPTDELAAEPYKLEFEAVDALEAGDVMVVAGAGRHGAFWGELLSTSALRRGCRGAVVDGMARDCRAIIKLSFPLFLTAISPADSYGRLEVTGYGEPVICGGVQVARGDIVFGDYDGVVVIPAGIADEVIRQAWTKVKAEDQVRASLEAGATVTETYRRYGVM